MKHLKYLLRVGHVLTLLIIGVLGGLMVPLPSEAGTPTATIYIDGSPYPLGTLAPCAVPTGYRACYALPQNGTYSGSNGAVTRQYTIKGYGGNLPRLLVADSNGSGLDVITLTTVEFAPKVLDWGSTNTTEKHTLKVTTTHRFDNVPNPKGTYLFALRTSGMFKSNVTNLSASSDFVKFEGTGIFTGATSRTLLAPLPSGATCDPYNSRSTDVNYCPLKRTMATTTFNTSSFSSSPPLEQISPYPGYACDNGAGSCTPSVTLTMTAVLVGPDSFILSSSDDAAGGSCNLDPIGPPTSTQAIPCHTGGKGKKSLDQMISDYFGQQRALDQAAFLAANPPANPTPACSSDPDTGDCVCQDPDVCVANATITINEDVNSGFDCLESDCSGIVIVFNVVGPTNTTATITTANTGLGQTVVNVLAGTYSVTRSSPPNWIDISAACGGGATSNFPVPANGNVTCDFQSQPQIN